MLVQSRRGMALAIGGGFDPARRRERAFPHAFRHHSTAASLEPQADTFGGGSFRVWRPYHGQKKSIKASLSTTPGVQFA